MDVAVSRRSGLARPRSVVAGSLACALRRFCSGLHQNLLGDSRVVRALPAEAAIRRLSDRLQPSR
jgi:hypothetical protein